MLSLGADTRRIVIVITIIIMSMMHAAMPYAVDCPVEVRRMALSWNELLPKVKPIWYSSDTSDEPAG